MTRTKNLCVDLIPVTVLTGFLGSGKTTILAQLVQNPAFVDTAIIINEFGEVGLDHALLEASDESIVDLSCGCICCTIRGDLVSTLTNLYERRTCGEIQEFKRVVIETTGLADPAPIIHTLMQEPKVFDNYRLARVVTTIDAVNGMRVLDHNPEAIKQVAMADTLLITKNDINDPLGIGPLTDRLDGLNPGAVRSICIHGETDPMYFFSGGIYDPSEKSRDVSNWLTKEAASSRHNHHSDINRHGSGIQTFALLRTKAISRGALAIFMQMLADQKGDDLLRLKGLVHLIENPEWPAVVHGVQHVIHPIKRLYAWPDNIVQTRLVFIVKGIEKEWVEDLLNKVTDSAYAGLSV
ncbi:MAG: GTP-binding protein [Alphaproteobacteria bacterium]|nr:GTP-binding protein [Alphaproteobacteria bacterium]